MYKETEEMQRWHGPTGNEGTTKGRHPSAQSPSENRTEESQCLLGVYFVPGPVVSPYPIPPAVRDSQTILLLGELSSSALLSSPASFRQLETTMASLFFKLYFTLYFHFWFTHNHNPKGFCSLGISHPQWWGGGSVFWPLSQVCSDPKMWWHFIILASKKSKSPCD
jgi:hypothetical protein